MRVDDFYGKSSYALKKERVWERFVEALEDCRSILELDRLKEEYEETTKTEQWNSIFITMMEEEFEKAEQALEQKNG